MGGGLIQLVLTGYQDSFLVSNPEITYFKFIYKRYTNFAIECIEQYFNIQPDFGSRVTCTISKNADLLSRIYLMINLPPIGKFIDYPGDTGIGNSSFAQCAWVKNIGFQIIKMVELEIGGKVIDRHYSDWMYIWSELSTTLSKKPGLNKMIGNVPELTEFTNGKKSYQLYIPLFFYFCKNTVLALPLISIGQADIKINIEFNDLDSCLILAPTHYIIINEDMVNFKPYENIVQIVQNVQYMAKYIYFDIINKKLYYVKITNEPLVNSAPIAGIESNFIVTPVGNTNIERLYLDKDRYFPYTLNMTLGSASLLVDYIYIDPDERKKFKDKEHIYIIETLQYDNPKILYHSSNKIKVGYNNSCKEIIFRGQYEFYNSGYSNDQFNYTNLNNNSIILNARLLLNGLERIPQSDMIYFEKIQNFFTHTAELPPGVGCYCFAINPEESMPSGTCNFSKMDDIVLQISVDTGVSYNRPITFRIYAICLNVLKIKDGIISLEF